MDFISNNHRSQFARFELGDQLTAHAEELLPLASKLSILMY